ncbi:hypothetical protein ACFW4K_16015 [Nocardiopsis alba]|uniref:hypothetical protein n=1 Tax=Nocardiopsis alba TaxID=53437 RepID=UPI00366EED8A
MSFTDEYYSLTDDQAWKIASRLGSDCLDQGWVLPDGRPDIHGYVTDLARNNPVPPGADGQTFAFWSFKSAPDPSSAPVGHRFVAQACSESRDYAVLETTDTGKKLDSYRLFEPPVIEAIEKQYDIKEKEVKEARKEAWSALSTSYTQAARGEARVFAPDVAHDSVLGRDEIPQLLVNKNVGLENIHFEMDLPKHDHLPDQVQSFLENDMVRAQVTMDHYAENGPSSDVLVGQGLAPDTAPPHALAHKLEGIRVSPDLQDDRDRAVGLLRSGNSYRDLKDPGAVAVVTVDGSGTARSAKAVSISPSAADLLGRAKSGGAVHSGGSGGARSSSGADVMRAHERSGPPVRGGVSSGGRAPHSGFPHQGGSKKGQGRGD